MTDMGNSKHLVQPKEAAAIPLTSSIQSPATSLFHRSEWEDVFGVYGLKVHRVAIPDSDRKLAVVNLRSRLFGSQLVSLPWFDAAGVGEALESSDSRDELVRAILDLADHCGAPVVQIRESRSTELSEHVRTDKVTQILQLESDPQDLWAQLKPKVRNQVRKSEKSGLTVVRGGAELLPEFFKVYSRNMRDLGTPSHSKRMFEVVLSQFRNEASIYLVQHDDTVIGSGLTLANGEQLEIPWASSLRKYDSLCVNHAMYWRILEDACQARFQRFSFGRSTKDSGTYRFKKQWRPDEQQLYWYFLSRRRDLAAAAATEPRERFSFASRLWRHLPLSLSRPIGQWIMAQVP